jgi:hypothetical protein
MEKAIKSTGKCVFCGKMFGKIGLNRHLKTHLIERPNKSGTSFLVKIATPMRQGATPYFLSLWIDGEASLKDIDLFLRQIWLECCSTHKSSFKYQDKIHLNVHISSNTAVFAKVLSPSHGSVDKEDIIPMERKTKDIFFADLRLDYEFDATNPTNLEITVIEVFHIKSDENVMLLCRNKPMAWSCDLCKKATATQVCTAHAKGETRLFCNECAKIHAKECTKFKKSARPVVNSPRMGVCSYKGGTIDKERD